MARNRKIPSQAPFGDSALPPPAHAASPLERLATIDDVMRATQLSRSTIARLVKANVLPAIRYNGTVRFRPNSVNETFRKLEGGKKP